MVASADAIFDVLDSAFGSVGEPYFRRFMRNSLTDKWMISADFVIGEPAAVHDVFSFTIFPHYKEFSATIEDIAKIFPRDLKRTKVLTDDMVAFLRDNMRFHFCFLVEKDRYKIGCVEDARVAIAHALQVVQGLDTGGSASTEKRRDRYIQSLRKVAEEARANRFNYQNFFDIHILSVLLATVMLWIVRHGECRLVGLFPDRDKMTSGCGGIFNALTEINHSGFCQRIGLNTEKDIIAPSAEVLGNGGDFFYDALVRIPDYVAGALSRLDYQSRTMASEKEKHKDLVERFASNNPNLLIIQISESLVCLQASTIRLTTGPNSFPLISFEDWMEYVAAKAQGFERRKRPSYRQCLLGHASDWPLFSRMLRSLLRGVAAGHPGCTATFRGEL